MIQLLLVLNSIVVTMCTTMFNVKKLCCIFPISICVRTIPTETASSSRLVLSLCVTVYCEVGAEFDV